MEKPIVQQVNFKVSPARVYKTYLSSKEHAAAIGATASIQARVGGKFAAFGMLQGRILHLVKDRLIVQTWRSVSWKKSDPDSILILEFEKTKTGSRVLLMHHGVPAYDQKGVKKGWPNYYWKPWAKYFKGGSLKILSLLMLFASFFPIAAVAQNPNASQPIPGLEKRCGWIDNPTPGNWWLTDKDGEWIIGAQGGRQAEGDLPDFPDSNWVKTNGNYGYGCACLLVKVDQKEKLILQIKSGQALPLQKCRADKSLKPR